MKRIKATIVKVGNIVFCGPNDYEVSVELKLYPDKEDGFDGWKILRLSEVVNWFGTTPGGYSVKYGIEPGAVIDFCSSPVFRQELKDVHFLPYKDEKNNRLL